MVLSALEIRKGIQPYNLLWLREEPSECLRAVEIRTPVTEIYEQAGIQPIKDRMKSLCERAISKFDKNSKGLKDLAALKEVIGA